MELAKLAIVIIILGAGISTIDATLREGNFWDNYWEKTTLINAITNSDTTAEKLTDEETLFAQQSEQTIEDMGGFSKFVLAVGGFFIFIGKTVFGSLIMTIKIATYPTGGDTILRMVAAMCAAFLAILQSFLGMKMYSWIANKDTR